VTDQAQLSGDFEVVYSDGSVGRVFNTLVWDVTTAGVLLWRDQADTMHCISPTGWSRVHQLKGYSPNG
jgi:hypothetical protein